MFPHLRTALSIRLIVLVVIVFLLLVAFIGVFAAFYLAVSAAVAAPAAALLTAALAGLAAGLLSAVTFCRWSPRRHDRPVIDSVADSLLGDLEQFAKDHPRDLAATAMVAGLVVGASPRTRKLMLGMLDRVVRSI